MADPVILCDEQLRELALIIYKQEAGAISKIKFKSEPDRAKYLRDIRENYESVLELLKDGAEVKSKFDQDHDDTLTPIAHEIFMYVVHSANRALQNVRNYTLRTSYLSKVSEHSQSLIKRLGELNPRDLANVKDLTDELVVSNNAVLESMRKRQSPESSSFSQWLEGTGLNPDKLVKKAQKSLGFKGPFEDLKEEEKLQVYKKILFEAGYKFVEKWPSRALGAAGMAVLVFTAGLMVWDILSSKHPLHTATRDAVEIAASVGGGMLGEVVGAAVATEALADVEVSALFVTIAGLAGGIAGSFIVGSFAVWFIDLIIGSGGSASTFSPEEHRCCVAPMPDGVALARQIAHQQESSKQGLLNSS